MPHTARTIKNMLALRMWCRENLPTEDSLIAYDLMLLIAFNHSHQNKLSVKQLFNSLPHSYTAVRQHYNRFVKDGWIKHSNHTTDKRIKYIEPTEKFTITITNYTITVASIFKSPLL